jgi:enoyl-CoA hydratase/carnithine racemase
MDQELTTVAIQDRVATIRFNNPPLNIMSYRLRSGLMQKLIELEHNTDVSVVIFESAGDKAFSVGFDLKEFPENEAGGLQMIRFAHHVLNMIFSLPQITIVKLRGHVLGGGACLMLACDLRTASTDAKIGMPEIKFGAFSAGGGTHMLARQIGLARAKELVLLGDSINADEAKELGLVNRVVPAAALDHATNEIAERLAAMSRPALRAAKRSVNAALTAPFESAQTIEAAGMAELFRWPDVLEGVAAFNQKRGAKFIA